MRKFDYRLVSIELKKFLLKSMLLMIITMILSLPLNASSLLQAETMALNVKNATLTEILNRIKNEVGCEIFYISSEVAGKKGISISSNSISVKDILTISLKNTDLDYKFEKNRIIILKKETPTEKSQIERKKVTVSAVVIDSGSGKPIVGATVIVKETSAGAITDGNGKFFLIIEEGNEIEISYIGMEPYIEKATQNRGERTIALKPSVIAVKSVVITGYQTLNRREAAGAATTINPDEIRVIGAQSIEQSLQGKVAGMLVMNTSGEPSSTPKIRIRGNSTLNGNQSPLWVVDGIIQEQAVPFNNADINSDDAAYLIGGAIAGLNPLDIETITVLKDASATAIYGVKAANGVIVITTKKGVEGRPIVTYNGDITINMQPTYNNFSRMNSYERVQLSKEIVDAGINYPRIPSGSSYEGALQELYTKQITQDQFNAKVINLQGKNTDWFNELFRTSITHSQNVNVSGGTKAVKYYFSAGFNDSNGTAYGSDSKRFTSLGKIDVKVNKFIDFTYKVEFNTSENNGFYSGVNPFSYAYKTSRTQSAYNEDGSYAFYSKGGLQDIQYNFLNEIETTGESAKNSNFGSLLALNVKLLKGLSYSGTFSYNTSNANQRSWATDHSNVIAHMRGYNFNAYYDTDKEYKQSQIPYGGTLKTNNTKSRSYTIRNVLNYIRTFDDKHDVNVMAGVEARSTKYEGVGVTGYGWIPELGEIFAPVYTDKYIDNVVKKNGANPHNINSVTQVGSYFGTATYSYNSKYVLNANIRSDGANKFGSNPEYRWLPTYSAAVKWIISSEKFMQTQSVVDLLAFRASYGIQGNIHDDSTPYLIVKGGERDPVTGQPLSSITHLPNPDLRWERTKSWNVGVDFSLLDGRVSGAFDAYQKYTTDLIMNKTVSTASGRHRVSINGGEMNNFGLEANINIEVIRTTDFGWKLGVVLGRNINEVTLANGIESDNLDDIDMLLNGNLAVEGEAAGSMYSLRYAGLSRENGYPLFYAKDGRLVHEGEKQLMELVNTGSIFPDLSGGFDMQFSFKKRLTLTLGFTYNIGGAKRLPNVYEDSYDVFDPLTNVSTNIIDRWRKPGDETFTDIPALVDSRITENFYRDGLTATRPGVLDLNSFTNYYNMSDLRVVDSDYLRLRMIAVNYVVPTKFLKKVKISNMNIRFQANNLFVWANKEWEGLDPETPNATIPILPSYSLAISISF